MSDRALADNGDEQHPLLRHFRRELRRLRLKSGWTQEALAKKLEGWTEDTVSHIEVGRRDPGGKFAAACDRVFGTGESFQQLARAAGGEGDEDGFSGWIDIEREAATLRTWEPVIMPGLLQTEPYARAVNEAWQVVDGDRDPDRDVAERMARQEIFGRAPVPSFGAIIDEYVLYRPIGSAQTMRGQLAHLLEMAARPRVSIHILPANTGAHVGTLGAFMIASFADGRSTVYEETSTGYGRVAANPDATARVREIFDALRADALNARASREKIEGVMEEQWPE